MDTYKINLDYESYLFDKHFDENSLATQKKNREFEYVFFLVNNLACKLQNVRPYSTSYLAHLKNDGFTIPELVRTSTDGVEWWGHNDDFELAKKLNSKFTSVEIAKANNWGFDQGCLVADETSLRNHILHNSLIQNWILKQPHGFSGIGHYKFLAADVFESRFKYKFSGITLLEPFYERVFDIGTTIILKNGAVQDWFMVENYNSQSGSFRGGAGAADKKLFKDFIQSKYAFDLSSLESVILKIAQKYQQLGATKNIQVDSFVYRENGVLKLYPLVEVNYRKTMGLVIHALAEKLGENRVIEWLIYNKKETAQADLTNLIKISPEDNHFSSFVRKI